MKTRVAYSFKGNHFNKIFLSMTFENPPEEFSTWHSTQIQCKFSHISDSSFLALCICSVVISRHGLIHWSRGGYLKLWKTNFFDFKKSFWFLIFLKNFKNKCLSPEIWTRIQKVNIGKICYSLFMGLKHGWDWFIAWLFVLTSALRLSQSTLDLCQ